MQIEQKDPKTIRFAFSNEGEPLAYNEAIIRPAEKKTYIGYSRGMANCPKEVLETLYFDMFEYVKQKFPENEIFMGYISKNWSQAYEFAQSQGFFVVDETDLYELLELPEDALDYTTRIADETDFDEVFPAFQFNERLSLTFPDEQAFKNFVASLLSRKTVILAFKESILVGVLVYLRSAVKGTLILFLEVSPQYINAVNSLLTVLHDIRISNQWNDPIYFGRDGQHHLQNFKAKLVRTRVLLKLEK